LHWQVGPFGGTSAASTEQLAAELRASAGPAAGSTRSGTPGSASTGSASTEFTSTASGSPGRCFVIGVDGLSGAGKTGFARRLGAALGAPVLSTDDLVPGWDGLAESVGLLTDWVLRPLSIQGQLNQGRLNQDPLKTGNPLSAGPPARPAPVRWRRYDWQAGGPGEWVTLDPGDFLIVEGCCVGTPPAGAYLSYLIWIDAPAAERRRRLERRADWPWYAPHAAAWARQEAALHAPARTPEHADLIVDNGTGNSVGNGTADGTSASDGLANYP
jgi:hypothetical protein